MLTPDIVTKTACIIAGCEGAFIHALSPDANNLSVIGGLWDRLGPRYEEIPNRFGKTSVGLIYGKCETERSHADELQYIAGVFVSSDEGFPEGLSSHQIPEQLFAVFLHCGPIQGIGETVAEIYRDWLPQSGYQHAGIADIEIYDERFCADGEDSVLEYWISIQPHGAIGCD